MVTVVWDTWLKPDTEEEGLSLTRQVWSDMRSFDGYVSHQIFIDQDAPGHRSLSPSGGAARMRTVSGKNTRTPRRSTRSPRSSPPPGSLGDVRR